MYGNRWFQDWLGWLIVLTLVSGIVTAVNFYHSIGQPFGGYLTFYNPISNRWQIDIITPTWWTGISEANLATNSRLLEIDGRVYDYQIDEPALFREVYTRNPPTVTLKIEQEGELIEKQLRVLPFSWVHYLDLIVPHVIGGLTFWLLALIVYQIPSPELLNQVFVVMCCLGAINRWLSRVGLFVHTDVVTHIIDLVGLWSFSFLGSLFIHFALLFPTRARFHHKYLLYFVYGVGLIALIGYSGGRLVIWLNLPIAWAGQLDNLGFRIAWPLSMIGVGAIVVRLLATSIANPSRRLRRQALILLSGISLILPYLIAVWAIFLAGGEDEAHTLYWRGLDSRYLVAAGPAAAALIILRYQTFRRVPPLFLIVPVLAVSAIVANVGSVIWAWSLPFSPIAWKLPPFIPALGMTLIVSLIWVTQSSWRGFFGRVLHWRQQNDDAAKRFGQHVTSQADLSAMPKRIATALVSELQLERTAVWVWQEATESFQLVGQAGESVPPLPEHLPAAAVSLQQAVQFGGQAVTLPDWLSPFQQQPGLAMLVPLWIANRMTGLLGLGKRWDEEIFDERDLDIIDLIAQQSALFLLTAQQVEQLRQVPGHIALAQESERLKLARELHDTVQQLLGRLPFYLEVSRQTMWTTPGKADQLLDKSILDVEEAARAVRQIRNNLAPSQLEYGLMQPMVGLCEQFERRTGIQIVWYLHPSVDHVLSLEARHALYRVVQQALDNIEEHAQATAVNLTLNYENNRIAFCITDNGQGSSAEQRSQKQGQGAFGLRSMTARIQTLGGHFEFSSALGEGSCVQGWIPI
ncbi:MAG: GAF domain-containing protein [Chloroflexota bacterium]